MPLSGYLKVHCKSDTLVDIKKVQGTCHIWTVYAERREAFVSKSLRKLRPLGNFGRRNGNWLMVSGGCNSHPSKAHQRDGRQINR